jgi:hypothetical protein
MFIIVHTQDCAHAAEMISGHLEDCRLVPLDQVLSEPSCLGDFDSLGLVFGRDGKAAPAQVMDFIRRVLRDYDLSGLQYMFSLCVCDEGPAHALKIVEKLCSRIGCAPSLSTTIPMNASDQDYDALAGRIRSGEIQLAKGSIGTMWYMKAHGIKAK